MGTIIFIIIMSLCFLALVCCIIGLFWIDKIHRKWEKRIDEPWKALIERIKSRAISSEEGDKQHSFFMELANLSLKEYNRFSPFYIFRHWNDQYNEEWLRERKMQ